MPLDSAGQRDPEAVAGELTALGVDLVQVARQLEDKAVRLFQDSYAQLVDTVTAALNAAGADVHARRDRSPAGGGQRPIGGLAAVVNNRSQLDRIQQYLDDAKAKLPSSQQVRNSIPGK